MRSGASSTSADSQDGPSAGGGLAALDRRELEILAFEGQWWKYAGAKEQAVRELGAFRGTILAAWRVMRCNPFSNGGVDHVADRTLFRKDA